MFRCLRCAWSHRRWCNFENTYHIYASCMTCYTLHFIRYTLYVTRYTDFLMIYAISSFRGSTLIPQRRAPGLFKYLEAADFWKITYNPTVLHRNKSCLFAKTHVFVFVLVSAKSDLFWFQVAPTALVPCASERADKSVQEALTIMVEGALSDAVQPLYYGARIWVQCRHGILFAALSGDASVTLRQLIRTGRTTGRTDGLRTDDGQRTDGRRRRDKLRDGQTERTTTASTGWTRWDGRTIYIVPSYLRRDWDVMSHCVDHETASRDTHSKMPPDRRMD